MQRWRRWTATGAAAAVVAGAGAGGWALSGAGQPAAAPGGARRAAPARLVAYDTCSQLLGQVRAQALDEIRHGQLFMQQPSGARSYAVGASGGAQSGTALAAPAVAAPQATGAGAAAGSQSAAGTPGPSYSGTNDQEVGVDEPDLVKTDGRLLVALRTNSDTLEVADVSGSPALTGSLALGSLVQASGLFLVGNDVVVLGNAVSSAGSSSPGSIGSTANAPSGVATPIPGPALSPADQSVVPVASPPVVTEAVVVDVSNPEAPAVLRSFSIQGAEMAARLIKGTVEVVVSSSPTLPYVAPANQSAEAVSAAMAINRNSVDSSTVADWLPSVTSEPSGTTTTAPCASAMHTVSDSGLDTIGVVPIDPTSDRPGPEATVVGDAETVYASASNIYVAFSGASNPTPNPTPTPLTPSSTDETTIDAFDLSNPSSPAYAGSGSVPGTLIGQYAMSEYERYLRVATTVGTATPPPMEGTAPATLSDNRVTILSRQGGALVAVGSITGLGTGEKIYAVRFAGPLGYVVTFNQTDPLFVVDLSNPADPTLAGQLPLTGYSSFLEPLAGGLLFGVGQDVNSNLRTDGLQVSLFDVSDPTSPKLLDKAVLPDSYSPAEQDPHALAYWPAADLVVMPVSEMGGGVCTGPALGGGGPGPAGSTTPCPPATPFVGALAWKVTGDSLGSPSQISQPATPLPTPTVALTGNAGGGAMVEPASGQTVAGPALPATPEIERALVVGDMLYTVSESGIMASALDTLAPVSWMAYS